MDTLKLMKEYGQEVIDYQKLYGVFVRKHKREQEIQEKLQQIDQKFEFVKEWLPIQDKTISEKMAMLSRFIQEMEQMKFARSYQQNTLLKQEINQLKKKQKVMDTRIQRTIEPSWIILSFGSTCLFTKRPNKPNSR